MKYLLLIMILLISGCNNNTKTFITCENIKQFNKRTEIKGLIAGRELQIKTLNNKTIMLSNGAACYIEEIQ